MRTLGALLIVLLPASQAATPQDRYTLDDVLARAGQYTVDYGEALAERSCGGALRTASHLARRPQRQAGAQAPIGNRLRPPRQQHGMAHLPQRPSGRRRGDSRSGRPARAAAPRIAGVTAGSGATHRRRECPLQHRTDLRAISTFRRRPCTSCIRSIGPIADSTRNGKKCSVVSASGSFASRSESGEA